MALLELLITTVGAAVAKGLISVWLKDSPVSVAATASVVDILQAKTNNIIAARQGARVFDAIGDRIAENLEPLFASHEFGTTDNDASYAAVAKEVAEAIGIAKLSNSLLAQINHDPTRLAAYIKEQHPKSTEMLSEKEASLYNRTIELSAQYVIELAPTLPDYTKENFTEVLERLTAILSKVDEILAEFERLRSASEAFNSEDVHAYFEADYRAGVIRNLDQIQLIGVDVRRRLRRYQLTTAYVSLDMSTMSETLDEEVIEDRMPVEEALATTTRAAIIGEAGSGKTTLLRWLAVQSAGDSFGGEMQYRQKVLPIYVELRRFPETTPTMNELISSSVPELEDEIPRGYVRDIFANGRALLLVDGLDEISRVQREEVLDWLDNLSSLDEDNMVVITSRPSAIRKELLRDMGFDVYQLPPMHYTNAEKFVKHWHDAVLVGAGIEESSKAKLIVAKLIDQLKNNIALFRLATNPLLCAMICALHYERQAILPSDRSSLYEACIDMLLERRDSERGIKIIEHPTLSYKQKRLLLDDLAYWMIRNGYSRVRKKVAVERMSTKLRGMQNADYSAEAIMQMLIDRGGVLREPSLDTVDFVHKTFQEYMAASAINLGGDWGVLVQNASNDQWQETLILAAGFANEQQASQLIEALLDKASLEVADKQIYLSLLALSCLETAMMITPEVKLRVENLLEELVPPQSPKEIVQIAAAGDLAVPHLKRLEDYTEQQAANCVDALARIGSRAALLQLGDYFYDRREMVATAVERALHYLTPAQILDSGLLIILLDLIQLYREGDQVTLSGGFVNALAYAEPDDIRQAFKGIRVLYVRDFEPTNMIAIKMLSGLSGLRLAGDLRFDADTLQAISIQDLALQSLYGEWPDFSKSDLYAPQIRKLRLEGSDLPNLFHLGEMPNLRSLTLFSAKGSDLGGLDLTGIEQFKKLEHLHLASEDSLFEPLEISRLAECPACETLELTFHASQLYALREDSDYLDSFVYGLNDLEQIRILQINLPQETPHTFSDRIRGISEYLPWCKVQIKWRE